jgi:hypothetical protein
MCGRFTFYTPPDTLILEYFPEGMDVDGHFEPSYNIPPGIGIPMIRMSMNNTPVMRPPQSTSGKPSPIIAVSYPPTAGSNGNRRKTAKRLTTSRPLIHRRTPPYSSQAYGRQDSPMKPPPAPSSRSPLLNRSGTSITGSQWFSIRPA